MVIQNRPRSPEHKPQILSPKSNFVQVASSGTSWSLCENKANEPGDENLGQRLKVVWGLHS